MDRNEFWCITFDYCVCESIDKPPTKLFLSNLREFYIQQILGVKWMEMDSGVSHLTIVHMRLQINPEKINSEQFKGFYLDVRPQPPLR